MSHNQRLRKVSSQLAQQCQQRTFLLQCACVGRLSLGSESPFVADADGMAVVPPAMRPDLFQRTAAVDFTVTRHVEVIAYVAPATMADVVPAAIFKAQDHTLGCGRAMDDE